MQRPLVIWLAASALALGACTAILNQSADQCSKDADCNHFGAQYTCSAGLCRAPGGGVSSSGGPSSSGTLPDGGRCSPKSNKATNADFYNEPCTRSSCIPFDNCGRAGLCDGGPLPATIAPPDGGV